MAKHKKNSLHHAKVLTPYLVLTSPVLNQTITEENYRSEVIKFFFTENNPNLENQLNKLLSYKRFRENLNAFSKSIEDINAKPDYKAVTGNFRELKILKTLINFDIQNIQSFINLRDTFERSILIGDYCEARKSLETCKDECGESIWLIQSTILLLVLEGKLEEINKYSKECISRNNSEFIQSVINNFESLIGSDDALSPLKTDLLGTINEFNYAGFFEGASRMILMHVPDPLVTTCDYESALTSVQSFPIIDQYHYLLSLGQKYVTKTNLRQSQYAIKIIELLKDLSTNILDNQITAILNYGLTENTSLSEVTYKLYLDYESGNYLKVIDAFENHIEDYETPFSILNIVAKSYAYLGVEPIKKENVLHDLAQLFSDLYKLSKSQKFIEDAIISKIIKLHGLTQWPHLQAALYLAFPNKYNSEDIKDACHLSLATRGEVNPIVFNFANQNCSNENNEPLNITRFGNITNQNSYEDAIDYRKLKLKICNLIASQAEQDSIEQLFKVFKNINPLSKDYLELYAEFNLIYQNVDELVRFSTNALLNDPNVIFCFPMHKLIELIETNEIKSLEALTLVYFYNKYISQKMEYLLNEKFEDFLHFSNVTKPSELLKEKHTLNQLEQFFYKEICSLEILDFLSCFESSGELRFERVCILDMLSQLNVIDNESKMLEVDNIIGQYIVDSATSEINGPKISVDEAILIKNNLENINYLIKVYKLSSDEDDEGFFSLYPINEIPDEPQDTKAKLTGNKNGIIFKIIRTLVDSFLNDEKFGLDKNLSAEIRHGFFSNLIRARLLERYLITELNDKNEHLENTHWQEIYHYVNKHIYNDVDQDLKNFSKEVNNLLSEAEEWMQIKKIVNQNQRVFDYTSIDIEVILNVRELIEKGKDALEISEYVMSYVWSLTENFLHKIRDKLNEEFRIRLDSLFDILNESVSKSKRGAAMQELMSAIVQTKSDVHEDITTVTEWFRRVYNSGMQDHSLFHLIDIAIKAFKEVNGSKIEITNHVPNSYRDINVPGKAIKPFVISLINLFDNAFKRSGLGNDTNVKITGELISNNVHIYIQNNLSPEKYEHLVNNMSAIEEKINATNSIALMKQEGGSGLVKAINQMKFVSEQSKIKVRYTSDSFIVEVIYAL